jgi:topoisomerase-4 subunit A
LRQVGSIKKLKFDIDFAKLRSRTASKGMFTLNIRLRKSRLRERNFYLTAKKVWYDETVQRLNVDVKNSCEFRPSDKILIIQQSGKLKVVIPDIDSL